MKEILLRISEKKEQLDALRPLSAELDKNLYAWFKIALTYSSNAIEGNTISLAETAQIVEKQLTVSGKTINEHLEVLNHAQAVDFIQQQSQSSEVRRNTGEPSTVRVNDILDIHRIVLQKINDEWAGRFRTMAVRVVGSPLPCPNYLKVPQLMDELVHSIAESHEHVATLAARAHLQLAAIHPFVDGNGRTARLLMNLLLLQQGYPLVIIGAHERTQYIVAIQKALQGDSDDYYTLLYVAIERSLDEYLEAARSSK